MRVFHIIANAQALTPVLVQKLKTLNNIVALDGIAADCLRHGIIPDFVCGDFDSIPSQTLEQLQHLNCKLNHYPDQNYSDLDKGIFWCDDMSASSIHIFNALGGLRPDHTIFNYRILKRHYKEARPIVLEEEAATLHYIVDQSVSISGDIGALACILAYPQCTVSTKGLSYDMKEYALSFAETESASNQLAESTAILSIKGGALLIVGTSVSLSVVL